MLSEEEEGARERIVANNKGGRRQEVEQKSDSMELSV